MFSDFRASSSYNITRLIAVKHKRRYKQLYSALCPTSTLHTIHSTQHIVLSTPLSVLARVSLAATLWRLFTNENSQANETIAGSECLKLPASVTFVLNTASTPQIYKSTNMSVEIDPQELGFHRMLARSYSCRLGGYGRC